MKKCIAVLLVARALCLAGCCTTAEAGRWEYKVAGPTMEQLRERGGTQQFLNDLAKDGWILVSQNEGRTFYFKRPIK